MIWKFPLEAKDTQEIAMPIGARVLCVQIQRGIPCLWADRCQEGAPQASRVFFTHGTGHPMPKYPGKYIGTYQIEKSALVFHVYEEANGEEFTT